MNLCIIGNYIGRIMQIETLFMLPALVIALFQSEKEAAIAFTITAALLMLIGTLLTLIKPRDKGFYAREGFATVAFSWIIISIFGCLPFYFSGAIPSFIDCIFETVSGFTTTGASILTNVEVMPMSLLYWRSFTHWLGGMGVLVFLLAVMPLTGRGSGGMMKIMRAESPGPIVGKLVPKLHATAKILYAIYIALTILEMILLLAFGMPLFDSVNTAFATAGTGGFAIKNASLGAYGSYFIQGTVSVFMILFGCNFNIFYLLLLREFKQVFKSEELRLYFGIIAASVAVITINTISVFNSAFDAFHHSLFQVASIITTTGFATVDFNLWPQLSRCILCLLMVLGACAGSTGGGVKMARVLLLVKSMRNSVIKMIHPKSVRSVRVDGKTVEDGVIREVNSYLVIYLLLTVSSILIISLENFSFDTTVSSVLACINNIGPGLDIIGPTGNYAAFGVISKLVLIFDMLIGRLEIYPILLIFTPAAWDRSK